MACTSSVTYTAFNTEKIETASRRRRRRRRNNVRFEVLTAVTMKNAVFWDAALCRYCVNQHFGGTWRPYVPPKCRFTQYLHSTTSQKSAFFKKK
jgi:hypothetical protein